jgi:hypothetical protein
MFRHVDKNKILGPAAPLVIREKEALGAGEVTFTPAENCYVFLPGGVPISWLENQKCADGAILAARDSACAGIHLVELKSGIRASGWPNIKMQLEGLLHNVRALYAISGLTAPQQIKAYVAYRNDYISKANTAAPILLKMPLGLKAKQLGPSTEDWECNMISLLDDKNIPLVKIQRDENGNATASLS